MTDVARTSEPAVKMASPPRLADMVAMTNGINAARVIATVLVVMVHAGVPYLISPMPSGVWLLHDAAQHVTVDLFLLWVNGFVMPLFFLLAGLSAAKACANTSFREFISQRFRRLVSPFLLTAVLVLPVMYFSWGLGLLWTERVSMSHLIRLRFPDDLQRQLFGPVHLWFLEYLFLLSVGWCGLVKLGHRWPFTAHIVRGETAHAVLGSAWRPLVFAIPTAMIFVFDTGTPYRLPNTFVPDAMRLLHYAVFFIAGVWISTLPQALFKLRANAKTHLFLAALVFCGLFPLSLRYLNHDLPQSWFAVMSALQAIFAWCMVFGFLGASVTWFSSRRDSITYLNEASFWIYLAHLPIAGVIQLLVWPLEISAWGKVFIVTAVTLILSLVSFQFCVRYSLLGAIIHGARKHCPTRTGWRLEAGWLSLVAVGTILIGGFVWTGWEAIVGRNFHVVVDGHIYRSNRLKANDLNDLIETHGIRSVISMSHADETVPWYQAQQEVCDRHGIPLAAMEFLEHQVPSSRHFEQMNLALEHLPRPVLIEGNHRSPTLAGIGSAVAILVDGGSLDDALQQFDRRFFQLEGLEHCIVAKPLLEYRQWLSDNDSTHSAESFRHWSQQVHTTPESMTAAKQTEPIWQTRMGAPRYPRRF